MKNITDSLDDIMKAIEKLDKKLDDVIKQNEPPKDVIQLFEDIRADNCGMGHK